MNIKSGIFLFIFSISTSIAFLGQSMNEASANCHPIKGIGLYLNETSGYKVTNRAIDCLSIVPRSSHYQEIVDIKTNLKRFL
tara:strand:- start:194 stop:439 length:246 start_codon:yes stop_codon:yes gene_type:complete